MHAVRLNQHRHTCESFSTSYSLIHLIVAIAVTYAITRDWRAALADGLIEPAVQTVAFLIHDRIWSRIEAKDRA